MQALEAGFIAERSKVPAARTGQCRLQQRRVEKEEKSAPSSVRRDKPSVFSSAALANCTAPSERSTATSVDIRSSE